MVNLDYWYRVPSARECGHCGTPASDLQVKVNYLHHAAISEGVKQDRLRDPLCKCVFKVLNSLQIARPKKFCQESTVMRGVALGFSSSAAFQSGSCDLQKRHSTSSLQEIMLFYSEFWWHLQSQI